MAETGFFEFEHGGSPYVARVTFYDGGGGWGRVDVFHGARVVGCGEFSRRGIVYLTVPVKGMRPALERMIDATAETSAR